MKTTKIKNGKIEIVEETTLTPDWGKKDFMEFTPLFVSIRSKHKEKFNRCFVCDWPFQIKTDDKKGEMMSLVAFKGPTTNKLVCSDCFEDLNIQKIIGEVDAEKTK